MKMLKVEAIYPAAFEPSTTSLITFPASLTRSITNAASIRRSDI
ncbi:hypothetical protein [Mesorhizobium sp. M0085]